MTKAQRIKNPQTQQTPALSIESRDLESLLPYVRNSRTHSDEQIALIAGSLVEFGWTNPILVDGKGGIIAGHGRLLAARKVRDAGGAIPNWEDTSAAPCIEHAHMTEAQRRAYVIADNQLALRAGWDFEVLAVELDELRDLDFDISLLGFEPGDLAGMIGTPDEPPAPESGATNVSRNLLMIECTGERELETLFDEMKQRGYECKILS